MAERREVTIPPVVLGLVLVGGGLGLVGLIAAVVVLTVYAEANVVGPAEQVNRKVAEAYLAAVRAGEPGPLAAQDQLWISDEGLAAVKASTSHSEYDTTGAYVDASHGTTCFEYELVTPTGSQWVIVAVDSDHGAPLVTTLGTMDQCNCRRRKGLAHCS